MRDVAADRHLAAAGVDDVRVRLGDGDGADRAAEEAVGDVLPGAAAVGRLPDAAAGAAEVVGVAVAGQAGDGGHAAAAVGADLAPLHPLEQGGIDRRLGRRAPGGAAWTARQRQDQQEGERWIGGTEISSCLRDSLERSCFLPHPVAELFDVLEMRHRPARTAGRSGGGGAWTGPSGSLRRSACRAAGRTGRRD